MGYTNTEKAVIGYSALTAAAFWTNGAQVVADAWPNIKAETCTRKGCTPTLEWEVGCIYMQVIGSFSLIFAMVTAFPGTKGILAAMGVLFATFAKHITIDGLMPPPPVMVMATGVLAANLLKPGKIGTNAFLGYMAINLVVFTLNPKQVLTDTWANIEEGTDAYSVGLLCLEVVKLYVAMTATVVATANTQVGYALAWSLGAPVMAKHVLIDNSGPPAAMQLVYVALLAFIWKENDWKNLKPAAEKSMAQPIKLHGYICSSFVVYFALEAFGIGLPMLGWAAIDDSYAYTGATAFMGMMMAIAFAMICYNELSGKMEGKLFFAYHVPLSAAVFFWQCQPSTTTIGKLFFMAPHVFTVWSTYIVLKQSTTYPKLA